MQLWISEVHNDEMTLSFRATQTLYSYKSAFQQIDIVDTARFGRMLLLDGCVMTTEKDEFVYHEMIAHVPMIAHPNPKHVLVIGGGDGGTVRELVKHPELDSVVLCEIDGDVIESCKIYLPSIASALEHPKVHVVVGDGVAYVAQQEAAFDLIIVDSTDPIGPGEGLFTESFYHNVYKALKPDGILVAQTESPSACQPIIKRVYPMFQNIFPIVNMYTGHIPTYPSGFWSWSYCAKQYRPTALTETQLLRAKKIESFCQYYNSELHHAAFVLPNYVKQLFDLKKSQEVLVSK